MNFISLRRSTWGPRGSCSRFHAGKSWRWRCGSRVRRRIKNRWSYGGGGLGDGKNFTSAIQVGFVFALVRILPRLSKQAEVEVDGDGSAFGRIDLDGGSVRGEGLGGELKTQEGAGEDAAAFVTPIGGLAMVRERRQGFFSIAKGGDVEIAPKIGG